MTHVTAERHSTRSPASGRSARAAGVCHRGVRCLGSPLRARAGWRHLPRGATRRRKGPEVVRPPRSGSRRATSPRARPSAGRVAPHRPHRIRDARAALAAVPAPSIPLFTARRTRLARVVMGHVLAHLGDRFPVTDLSQSHLDAYAAKRRSGELGDRRRPVSVRGIRDGTARSELTWLASVFNFACGFRVNGRPLLGTNPCGGSRCRASGISAGRSRARSAIA